MFPCIYSRREVEEGASHGNCNVPFSFLEGFSWEKIFLAGNSCHGCAEICQRLACWERGVQCVGSFSRREVLDIFRFSNFRFLHFMISWNAYARNKKYKTYWVTWIFYQKNLKSVARSLIPRPFLFLKIIKKKKRNLRKSACWFYIF